MANIKFLKTPSVPLEMHKVRIVQKLNFPPIDRRLHAIEEAGFNTFLLTNQDIFMDMLTDSGVNAMSDQQLAAMMIADDSYAGSMTFFKLDKKLKEIFGFPYFLPVHQGRAAENILGMSFVTEGSIIPMNYHFTTAKAHIVRNGGSIVELLHEDALDPQSLNPFKGNLNVAKLKAIIDASKDKIAFVRMEAGTNLIGGQPFSVENALEVSQLCHKHKIPLVMDASLLQDNLHFIKVREAKFKDKSIREITKILADAFDIIYFSARKLGFAKGGGILIRSSEHFKKMQTLVPLFEGFLTYGGMSVKEMEALVVGLDETMDEDIISQGPQFIEYMVNKLDAAGVPVVKPAGGLGCHIDARAFLPHVDNHAYPAGALAAALFLVGSIRSMERGTLSEQREADGTEPIASMELIRLALPRRVFTLSQVDFVIDRVIWLYEHRDLVGGLKWTDEPEILRFFFGKLQPNTNWPQKIVKAFKQDAQGSL